MGSQFVDLDGDGHLDYLTATFDGSPHVARGSAEGFGTPERLLDAGGERVLIAYYWNYDSRKHEVTGRALGTDQPPKERCISAWALDWDGDGDRDLLLGSYENGHLYRQMNEGSDAAPAYTGRIIPVLAGDEPFAIPEKMTAPRLVDWDGDGDLDLIAGSFGDSYGNDPGGAVYLSLNRGRSGAPAFGPLHTLVPRSGKGEAQPTRPDAGLYADAVDWDGDGDLDLLVGGYSMWTPAARPLDAEEQARVERLRGEIAEARKSQSATSREMLAAADAAAESADRTSDAWRKAYAEVALRYREELTRRSTEVRELQAQLDELVPSKQRKAFVWLYERL